MSLLPGFNVRRLRPLNEGDHTELVQLQRPLRRVLAFTRRSIHDVINDPIARNEVRIYYKLYRQIERGCEIVDLERWWNGESTL